MADDAGTPDDQLDLELGRPHSARVYDYLLGGKDNYPPDREVAEASIKLFPAIRVSAQQNRAFMRRVARHLAEDVGITQYLDIGTGIPTSPNLHEVVQEHQPAARVVYVDNDPIVLAHARALLVGDPRGRTSFIRADCRRPHDILDAPDLRATLDLDQPVALTVIAVMHFVPDDDEAYGIVRTLVDALPSGSYLGLTSATDDFDPETGARVRAQYAAGGVQLRTRTRAETERFFDGLELVDPGVVQVHLWNPTLADLAGPPLDPKNVGVYGGLARKP
jgi:SAM-dependent methyltransferase